MKEPNRVIKVVHNRASICTATTKTVPIRQGLNKLFIDYVVSLGFINTKTPDNKIYTHSKYPSIQVFICFFPCATGILILKNKREMYSDRTGDLEVFKKELAKYKDNE